MFFSINFCKVVGCASGVGLLLATLGPSFLDKGVGTGPAATQVGPTCAQTRPGFTRDVLMTGRIVSDKLW